MVSPQANKTPKRTASPALAGERAKKITYFFYLSDERLRGAADSEMQVATG